MAYLLMCTLYLQEDVEDVIREVGAAVCALRCSPQGRAGRTATYGRHASDWALEAALSCLRLLAD
jgi:hypothetical protein